MPDCILTNFAANGECGAIANAAASGRPAARSAGIDNARQGWGVREYNNQWSISVQQEVRPGSASPRASTTPTSTTPRSRSTPL